jgi:DNA-binding MarR family transcriptional regulator
MGTGLPPKSHLTVPMLEGIIKQVGGDVDAETSFLYITLRDLGRRIAALADEWLAEYGITERMLGILFKLYVHRARGPISFDQLAAREKMPPATLTVALDVLEGNGYIRRKPHATDGRRKVVSISVRGRRFLHALFEHHGRRLEEVFTFVDKADRAQLAALLTRVSQAFDAWEDRAEASRRTGAKGA